MRKTKLLIAILTLLINMSVIAQKKLGIKAGANFSKYSGTLLEAEYKHKIDFYAGGLINFKIKNNLKIQPEILFALQGSSIVIKGIEVINDSNGDSKIGDFETKTTEITISIPIVFQYFVAEKFYLEMGPQIGLILNRKEKIIKSPFEELELENLDYDTFDIGLASGIGYKLSEKLNLNFRYFFGLIERDLSQVKSSVINLGIEYNL